MRFVGQPSQYRWIVRPPRDVEMATAPAVCFPRASFGGRRGDPTRDPATRNIIPASVLSECTIS